MLSASMRACPYPIQSRGIIGERIAIGAHDLKGVQAHVVFGSDDNGLGDPQIEAIQHGGDRRKHTGHVRRVYEHFRRSSTGALSNPNENF